MGTESGLTSTSVRCSRSTEPFRNHRRWLCLRSAAPSCSSDGGGNARLDELVIGSVVLSDDGDYVVQATNSVACQIGEDDDLVETAPFSLDVDQNDTTNDAVTIVGVRNFQDISDATVRSRVLVTFVHDATIYST